MTKITLALLLLFGCARPASPPPAYPALGPLPATDGVEIHECPGYVICLDARGARFFAEVLRYAKAAKVQCSSD